MSNKYLYILLFCFCLLLINFYQIDDKKVDIINKLQVFSKKKNIETQWLQVDDIIINLINKYKDVLEDYILFKKKYKTTKIINSN